jgi:hypothetical protein
MSLRYIPMLTDQAESLRQGGTDAYGNLPERQISDGDGVPCRHCLRNVAAGDAYLIFALRPFTSLQPYAETGPAFMHAEECPAYSESVRPPVLNASKDYLLRGYGNNERIIYGTGGVIPTEQLESRAEALLAMPDVASVHVRSAKNNCYQCRIESA